MTNQSSTITIATANRRWIAVCGIIRQNAAVIDTGISASLARYGPNIAALADLHILQHHILNYCSISCVEKWILQSADDTESTVFLGCPFKSAGKCLLDFKCASICEIVSNLIFVSSTFNGIRLGNELLEVAGRSNKIVFVILH